MRQPLVVSLALLGLGGCSFFGALAGGGAGGGLVMAVDMEKVDVDAIALELPGTPTTWCPGQSGSFTVVAQGTERRGGKAVTLRTAPEGTTGSALRGKMDLVEFAMAARGGTVERGVFTASGDPFAALLGYDLRATYRNETDETTVVHLDPVYGCIRGAGSSGLAGEWGEGGYAGSDAGQAGSAGGPGGNGGPGPRIVAYATLVRTPKYDRMGLLRIEGDVEQLTLFDPAEGITVIASGGVGGTGGSGGDGAQGADPQGQGGPGGPGGDGGNGGDGGEVVLVVDDRYPDLAQHIGIDVAGGSPGDAGSGGYGGAGGPAPERACDSCEDPPPGPEGAAGPSGRPGSQGGRPGRSEVRVGDVTAAFASLPPGIALRDDPRPRPVAAQPAPTGGKTKRRRR